MVRNTVNIFYSYAHQDEVSRDDLHAHLSTLRRTMPIKIWHAGEIPPGTVWEEAITTQLDAADVILLLVSPDFINSDYSYKKELVKALERAARHEACVIPILLRPTDCEGTLFSKLQMLPTGAKPITLWSNRDEAWKDVAEGIRKVITAFLNQKNQASKTSILDSSPSLVLKEDQRGQPVARDPAKKLAKWIILIVAVLVAIVIVVMEGRGIFGWWVSTPPIPVSPTQTLTTFCNEMVAGNNGAAKTQFTPQGWLQFQPDQPRQRYSSCTPTYDPIPTSTDKTVPSHLVVMTNNQTYGIDVTLILDGNSWKINSWVSHKQSADAPLQLYVG